MHGRLRGQHVVGDIGLALGPTGCDPVGEGEGCTQRERGIRGIHAPRAGHGVEGVTGTNQRRPIGTSEVVACEMRLAYSDAKTGV